MTDLPTVVTAAGLQATPPATLLANLIAAVAATNPGYTANLPGSLIEDISSTDVAAIAQMESFRVELVNSLTPYGANDFLLNQLGQIYGVQVGEATRTSVYVVFAGTIGFVVAKGFTVSDGTYQYVIQDGGVVASGGTSPPLFALATQSGTWAVAAGTVTTLITSVPSTITLSVNNPEPGLPGAGAETAESYRQRVLQAGLAASQGMARYLKALLMNVSGVQSRLVSVVQQDDGWEVICGGGDPYEVGYAIYQALFDITSLQTSHINVLGITNAAQGNVTTDINHGYATHDTVTITGATPSGFNAIWSDVTVTGEKNFLIGNTSALGNYTSGGECTPNDRRLFASIIDYPDTYTVAFVNPPQQTVTMTITWNTTATNLVAPAAVSQAAAPAIADYINSIVVGQPINVFVMQEVFQVAVASIIPPALLTRMVFSVSINGIGTSPTSGTGIIEGDPESYFYTTSDDINVVQG